MLGYIDNVIDVVDLMIIVVVEQFPHVEVGMVHHDLGETVHVGDGVISAEVMPGVFGEPPVELIVAHDDIARLHTLHIREDLEGI